MLRSSLYAKARILTKNPIFVISFERLVVPSLKIQNFERKEVLSLNVYLYPIRRREGDRFESRCDTASYLKRLKMVPTAAMSDARHK